MIRTRKDTRKHRVETKNKYEALAESDGEEVERRDGEELEGFKKVCKKRGCRCQEQILILKEGRETAGKEIFKLTDLVWKKVEAAVDSGMVTPNVEKRTETTEEGAEGVAIEQSAAD